MLRFILFKIQTFTSNSTNSKPFPYLNPQIFSLGKIPNPGWWPCFNSTSLPCPVCSLHSPGHGAKCFSVGLRRFIYQQFFSRESPKMWVNKGQAKNKHFTVFFWIHFSGKSTYNKKVFVQLLPCQWGVKETSFGQLFLPF